MEALDVPRLGSGWSGAMEQRSGALWKSERTCSQPFSDRLLVLILKLRSFVSEEISTATDSLQPGPLQNGSQS